MITKSELSCALRSGEYVLKYRGSAEYIKYDGEDYREYNCDGYCRRRSSLADAYSKYLGGMYELVSAKCVEPMGFDEFKNNMLNRHMYYSLVPYRLDDTNGTVYTYDKMNEVWMLSSFSLSELYDRYYHFMSAFCFRWRIPDDIWNSPINPRSSRYV